MRESTTKIAITCGAATVAALNLVFPDTLNAVTLGCLAVAILPWLGAVFRSVELPSGLRVEYKDVRKVEEEAAKAGLLAPAAPSSEDRPLFATLADRDPNLALAGLRIELERRLVALGERHEVPQGRRGLHGLLRALQERGVFTQEELSALSDVIGMANQAVHGAYVTQDAAAWAIDVGPRLLAALDAKLRTQ